MKTHNISPQQSTGFFRLLFDYVVFLLSPEDSSDLPDLVKRQPASRFDSRFHGAMKIFFWLGFTAFFWIGLVLLFRILR
ncbi:MAG: hypothetical protein A2X81_08585 [Desulfobacterales bacterium GWB2_56_26]|nr:MAG: hypothetical protein A2X81_08585 [Desulfobacterales bacterium GWB2_56_26]